MTVERNKAALLRLSQVPASIDCMEMAFFGRTFVLPFMAMLSLSGVFISIRIRSITGYILIASIFPPKTLHFQFKLKSTTSTKKLESHATRRPRF